MQKTIIIKGMMCSHCEKTVKKALEAIAGVKAQVSHSSGLAEVTSDSSVSDDQLRKAVEDSGFTVEKIS